MKKQEQYKRIIKKHLYFGGSLSSNELSVLTNKSLPLTIKTVNELISENEVIETGLAISTGGRRPQMYSLRSDLMFIVAVAVDQLVTRIVLLDMQGNHRIEPATVELNLKDNANALYELAEFINDYIEQSAIERELIIGIGIGMPGFVDFNNGINHSFFKNFKGSIVVYIESVTRLPVMIDNDSSLIALAELRHGQWGRENFMVLNIGWGVGLGIILNGKLFRGNDGFAGEFSHIPIFNNNKICSCGKMGCIETETSLIYIIQKALEGIQAGVPTRLKKLDVNHPEEANKQIMKAALEGDKFAINLISQTGYNIGRGIAILAHLLNPELVVISGRGAIGKKLWLAPIQQAINEHCIPKIAENLEIKISGLEYSAELIGASDLIMEHYDEKYLINNKQKTLV